MATSNISYLSNLSKDDLLSVVIHSINGMKLYLMILYLM